MGLESTDHHLLAKDFLRLSLDELKAKYPEDEEVQGALAQITLIRKRFHIGDGSSMAHDMIEVAIRKRIALNLAQGLPILVPNIDEYCRELSAHR
ncbi:hypothetical protein [Marinobacter sediminicola]|uniref:hypothetical protein n=1 Tax=Marinobacter sediminicola TaxID=3072994 RepID=UPI002605F73F|nr:hypothetical protein [Marinobacter sp. F26243]